jgi:DNA-binding transcriptional ArsR family regulator
MNSSVGARAKTKGLPAPVRDVTVEVDWGTGYELLLGLRMLVDRDEDPASYAAGPEWFERTRALLEPEVLSAIERYSGGHEILFGYLLALAADAPAARDAAAVVASVAAVSPFDLRRLLLGGRLSTYRGDVPPEAVDAAAQGDSGAARALLAGCLDWQREAYEHVLSLDADEAKRLLEIACRGWHAAVLGPEERGTARVLRRSARATRTLAERLRPPDLVDRATSGVRYDGEPGIDRILLAPHVVSRPWSIFTESGSTKIVCYGVDDSQLTGDAPPDPLVAAYKALGDETRLRILRRLSEGPAGLVELTELTGLAKSTVHGHLLVLRTGGLVVAEASKKGSYSLRRETLAESAALLETYLEGTEE